MSFHHELTLQRYGLGRPADMYSTANSDPVFFPIFSGLLVSSGLSVGAASIGASVLSAIAAGGDFWEFKP